jgi:nucleotide-binding universal stress UspA family protein
MFRSMLVAVKPWGKQAETAEYAAALAQRCGLTVEGLSAIDAERLAPPESVPIGAGAFKVHRDEERLRAARQTAATRLGELQAACDGRGVVCRTSARDGDVAVVLASAAQGADLLLCGLAGESTSLNRATLTSILKNSPRPALAVPAGTRLFDTVLVAYDRSYQAARALAALVFSGFAAGCSIHIVSLDEQVERAEEPAAIAQSYLSRHGIGASLRPAKLTAPAGRQILDEAHNVGAGLIVMGAFGRTAAREFLFGSVTRSVLDAGSVAVLMDH